MKQICPIVVSMTEKVCISLINHFIASIVTRPSSFRPLSSHALATPMLEARTNQSITTQNETPIPVKSRKRVVNRIASSETNSQAILDKNPTLSMELAPPTESRDLLRLRKRAMEEIEEEEIQFDDEIPAVGITRPGLQPDILRERQAAKNKPRRSPSHRQLQTVGIEPSKAIAAEKGPRKPKRAKLSMRDGNPFFDHEAELSDDGRFDDGAESDFEHDPSLDQDLAGFIANSQVESQANTQMRTVYLESIQCAKVDEEAIKVTRLLFII